MRAVPVLSFLWMVALVCRAGADEAIEVREDAVAESELALGPAVAVATLEEQRGGDEDVVTNIIRVTGDVSGNSATDVATGANTIREGSFADASGLTTVVQNTGANVLIQSATIVNVQLVDP